MDLSADSGTLPNHTTVGGPVLEQELSLPNAQCQAESGGTILLQLLEFKTHLLEAVEELHIRRDAETRFEDQISKLVLEKQELDWEKESLQHQIETVANQHTETLINVKKQLQAKIRNIEEEKGKYQVSAELKEKEINNLKEELKMLQLLKYNLEKKSSELEQKLALQNRSKDSHLNQLGEVEKRFSAVSRQCAMVKQAHEKLEQNVDEAMKINKKLTTVNEKQEATIVSLKKELEEVSNKLIKAKMSSVRHDKAHSPTGSEQHFQQLQQKLNMETEMNKKLGNENLAVRAEKQAVMKCLQHTQQLLLSQTQTVSKVELELQTQREQYQALKQEHHRVMREKNKAMEEKIAQLMENYAASKNRWDNEKSVFLDCIKSEQQDLQAVKEAYNKLHQGHTELSSQAKVQAQHIYELKMRDSSQSLGVSTKVFPNLVEEIREEETLNEPISSSKLPGFESLQPLASSVTKNPDCLEDTGAVTKLVAIRVTGESTVSSPGYSSINGSVDLLSKEKSDKGNAEMSEKEQGWKDDVKQVQNNGEDGERIEEQQWNKEEVKGEDVKEGGSAGEMGVSAGEKRGTLMAQTTDRADRQDCSQGSTEDAGDPKQLETETKHSTEGEGTYGAEERGKTALHTTETQIPAQTTADMTTKKSNTQQVIDFMDTEPPLAACEPSDGSQNLFQKISEKDADSSHVKKGNEIRREVHTFCSDEHQSVNLGPNFVIQEVQPLCNDEDQTFAKSVSQLPSPTHQVSEKTKEEKPSNKSAAKIPTEPSGPLNESSICCSQTNSASLAAQSDGIVGIQEFETTTTQTQLNNLSDITSDMKQADKMCDNEECVLLTTMLESHAFPQSQVTDNDDNGYSSACKKESQSNVKTWENDPCETGQELMEKSNLKDACAYITMDTVNLESWIETGSYQEHMENDKIEDAGDAKTTKSETVLKLSVHPSHESNASPETGSKKYYEQSPANKLLLDDTIELSLPSNKTYRSSFDLGSAQTKTGSPMSEQNNSGSGGLLRHPASTIPMFLKSKHNKVPLVISRASDLLNASSVCGTAASIRRQQGEWKALGETFRETATADMESSASVSVTSFPVSTSITVSRLSWPTTPGCSRAPTSTVGPGSESDWEPSCSQEREDEQSSFRAHISKIEQFLNTERLRLPKRQKTEN
ncbi:coiled-coil domain-containing protein 73 isoform X1 [Etheostoma spectabile]|uniref:coiled-coil domain-containing protein 73 isoform X1 n=1 Tax=Etheostoma spectabile TaxID=54343 RepID=UPI0013AEEF79|nr:coiled-coil domain-containing protein 73 isoform X1 [Etheostoma spectabile]XP_032380507.1 coiled-coil domain-containing protein 73 isoform X1 [Etheostoma spectabile]